MPPRRRHGQELRRHHGQQAGAEGGGSLMYLYAPTRDALKSPRGSAMPQPEATPTAAMACASARGWRTAVLASSASRVPIHRLSVKAKEERVRTPPGGLPVIVKGHRKGAAEGGTPSAVQRWYGQKMLSVPSPSGVTGTPRR